MKIIMKSFMKNNELRPLKIWSSAVQLVVLSLVLLLSQLTLAKDRIQYHVQNFDGSTLKVINDQGVVSQSYQYAPFGQQLQYKKPSNLNSPNAFVGGIQDAGDLVYLKARHYNPVLGRFYQPDPVTFIMKGHGQTNRYQYGWNDTYTFSDSLGTSVELIDDKVMGAAVFGTIVHSVFAAQLNLALDWSGSTSFTYWGLGFKPDGVQTEGDIGRVNLFELKPMSYKNNTSLYNSGISQLRNYGLVAGIEYFPYTINMGGTLPSSVKSFRMPYLDGYWYKVSYDTSLTRSTGMVFYSKERMERMTQNERLKYTSAAIITASVVVGMNLASRGKVQTPSFVIPALKGF